MPSSSSNSFDNPWESASNDHSYKAAHDERRLQEQSTGEVPSEESSSNAAAATSARLDWANDTPAISSMNVSNNQGTSSSTTTNRQLSLPSQQHRPRHHNIVYSCCKIMLVSPHHGLSALDGILTLSILIFLGYTLHEHHSKEQEDMTPQQIAIVVVSVLIAMMITGRALFVSFLFPTKRCSKSCATYLTLTLCGCYAFLALSAWIVINEKGGDLLPWCWSVGSWCSKSPKALPITLTVLCFIEALRWIFAQGQLSQFDQDHPDVAPQQQTFHGHNDEDSFSTSRRHRPWWWNRHSFSRNHHEEDGMYHSLLGANGQPGWSTSGNQSYLMDDGVGDQPQSRRGFLGGWFGNPSAGSGSNPRDDGSVDYASLNEEWASRSEEDPYWWTREENNQGNN